MDSELGQDTHNVSEHLHEQVLQSADMEAFLNEMARFSAANLSTPERDVVCSITLVRRKRPTTVAASDPTAKEMDELQYDVGDGPCLAAIREQSPMYVPNLTSEHRWPGYTSMVSRFGFSSMLAVPFPYQGDAGAALNIYCAGPDGFSADAIGKAETFALHASQALRLTLRIANLSDARDDLSAAMQSRTTIDVAVGIIMGQNRCSQNTAMQIMKNASSTRNLKLRELAATIVESTSSGGVSTHFED